MEDNIKFVSIIIITLIIGILFGYLYNKRKKKTDISTPANPTRANYDLIDVQPFQIKETKKVIFGEINNPDIEISAYKPDHQLSKYEEFTLPESVKTGLQSLIHQVPNLTSSALQLSKSVYEVTFSPQVMKGLSNGSNILMKTVDTQKAVAMGKDGIKELGNVISGPGINPAMTALAVWQVLSIVTAQKFLSDINENLKKIENNIFLIKSFLDKDRLHKIIANIKYLNNISKIIQKKELNEADVITYNNQIENIERECLHIQQSLYSDLENSIKNFNEIQFKIGMFGPSLNESYEVATEKISEFHNFSRSIYMSMYLRTIAAQLKNSLPIDRNISQIRLNEIHEDSINLSNLTETFEKRIRSKIPGLKSKLRTKETDKKYRANLKELNKSVMLDLSKLNSEIKNLHNSVESKIKQTLEETSQPYRLVIEADKDQKIKSVKKINK